MFGVKFQVIKSLKLSGGCDHEPVSFQAVCYTYYKQKTENVKQIVFLHITRDIHVILLITCKSYHKKPQLIQFIQCELSLSRSTFSLIGVGKTSLVHLVCQNEPTTNPGWTIGCSVDVRVNLFLLTFLISQNALKEIFRQQTHK